MSYMNVTPTWQWGVLWNWTSGWIGAHWSKRDKRLCVNLIPFGTFWFTAPGGVIPGKDYGRVHRISN